MASADVIAKRFLDDFADHLGDVAQGLYATADPDLRTLTAGDSCWVCPMVYSGIPEMIKLRCESPTEVKLAKPLAGSKTIFEFARWKRDVNRTKMHIHVNVFDLKWTSKVKATATFVRRSCIIEAGPDGRPKPPPAKRSRRKTSAKPDSQTSLP